MQNFVQYAEAAMKRCKITSYNKLSKELGIANSSIVRMRSGKVLPAAKTSPPGRTQINPRFKKYTKEYRK